MIHDLKPDENITEPGFYRMPLDRHHSQPCDGVSVTSSVLRTMELDCPGAVWAFHALNPNRYEQVQKEALDMGRAMHAWVEGGEDCLRRDFIVLPPETPPRPSPRMMTAVAKGTAVPGSVAAVDFWSKIRARQEKTGRALITHTQFEQIKAMGEALARDETATAVLGGEPEITMAWHDDETQLWVLSRLDNLTGDGLLSDFKRMSSRGAIFNAQMVHRRIWSHGYDMQMALGAEAYQRLTGEWPTDCAIVAQQDLPPYSAITVAIGENETAWGVARNHRAMRRFRECLDARYWPGPGESIGTYLLTDKQREAFEEQKRVGDLPDPANYGVAI